MGYPVSPPDLNPVNQLLIRSYLPYLQTCPKSYPPICSTMAAPNWISVGASISCLSTAAFHCSHPCFKSYPLTCSPMFAPS